MSLTVNPETKVASYCAGSQDIVLDLMCPNMEVEVDMVNGTVKLHGIQLGSTDFCLRETGRTALVCEEAINKVKEVSNMYIAFYVITLLVFVSTVSLLVALLLHIVIPDLRKSLFGKMKVCHLWSMFCAYLSLVSGLVAGESLLRDYIIACQVVGFSMQFFFLSSFFWLNVMSVDIWRTFRQIRRYRSVSERCAKRRRRFILYSAYAWGIPAIILAATIVMQELPSHLIKGVVRPDVGTRSCFFGTNWSKMVYFHFPIAFILVTNIGFFVLSSWSLIFGIWAPTKTVRIQRKLKKRFLTVLELFFVLGLTWIAEIVSWAISWKAGSHKIWRQTLPFDIINASQGLIILLALLVKPRMIRLIHCFMTGLPISQSITSLTTSFRRINSFKKSTSK